MSRHDYSDSFGEEDPLALARWRGRVASAIRGRRGQRLLRDMRTALDAMPEKRLVAESLEADGEVCALGAVGRLRGVAMAAIDPEDPEQVAAAFDIAEPLAREIAYENDDFMGTEEQRWEWMRRWCERRVQG